MGKAWKRKLGHLNLVEDVGDYHVGSEVVGFGLVGQADAVTQYVVAYRDDVFGDYIAALVQERVCAGGFSQRN